MTYVYRAKRDTRGITPAAVITEQATPADERLEILLEWRRYMTLNVKACEAYREEVDRDSPWKPLETDKSPSRRRELRQRPEARAKARAYQQKNRARIRETAQKREDAARRARSYSTTRSVAAMLKRRQKAA